MSHEKKLLAPPKCPTAFDYQTLAQTPRYDHAIQKQLLDLYNNLIKGIMAGNDMLRTLVGQNFVFEYPYTASGYSFLQTGTEPIISLDSLPTGESMHGWHILMRTFPNRMELKLMDTLFIPGYDRSYAKDVFNLKIENGVLKFHPSTCVYLRKSFLANERLSYLKEYIGKVVEDLTLGRFRALQLSKINQKSR